MSGFSIIDNSERLLSNVMSLRNKSGQVISSNIANAETPHFIPKRLEFETTLREMTGEKGGIKRTNSKHLTLSRTTGTATKDDRSTPAGPNGNAVDPQKEMAELAQNQLMFEAASAMLNKKIGLKKYMLSNIR